MPPLTRSLAISLATVTCTLAAGSGTAHASARCSQSGRSLLDALCPVTEYVGTQTRALTGTPSQPARTPRPPRPGTTTAKPSAPAPESTEPRTQRPPSTSREDARTLRRPGPRPRDVAPQPDTRSQMSRRHGPFPDGLPVMPQVAPSPPAMRVRAASPAPPGPPIGHALVSTAAGLAGLVCGLNITVLRRYRRRGRPSGTSAIGAR